MCDMSDMMAKMEMMHDEHKRLAAQIDAIAKYLKMDFKYNPESYEMVKPEELRKDVGIPMQVR